MEVNFTIDMLFILKVIVGSLGVAVLLLGAFCQLFSGWSFYGASDVSMWERLFYFIIMFVGIAMIGWGF